MWHKGIWKGHPVRLELTGVGLLVEQLKMMVATFNDNTRTISCYSSTNVTDETDLIAFYIELLSVHSIPKNNV